MHHVLHVLDAPGYTCLLFVPLGTWELFFTSQCSVHVVFVIPCLL